MRLDHLLSREIFIYCANGTEKHFPPEAVAFGFGFGGLSGIGTIRPVLVCLFGSLTFITCGFWGFLGWLFVFWRVDVSVFVMLFCENLVR